VRKGDTLSALAKRYHCTVDELKGINRLKGDGIVIGQKIRIPASQVAQTERTHAQPAEHEVAQMSSHEAGLPRMLDR
jgi:LysM repeat protein